jgi:hypothetical protein
MKGVPRALRCVPVLVAAILLLVPAFSRAEDYSLDIPGMEKVPYHLGGRLEVEFVLKGPDKDSAFYLLKYPDPAVAPSPDEYTGTLYLDAWYERGIARLSASTKADLQWTDSEWTEEIVLQEGYLSLKPSSSLTLDVGKRRFRWGTGYAWNPAAFLDRPKNPDDPELDREGYATVSAEYIRSFSGPFATLSLTAVVLPVYEDLNDDVGRTGKTDVVGRLYLLVYDTDVDFTLLSGGSRTARYGFDFSRNLGTNFEVHGEASFISDNTRRVLESDGTLRDATTDAVNLLLGVRYLTESDLTWIFEYCRNGTGYSKEEMEEFYDLVARGHERYISSGQDDLLRKARLAAGSGYGVANGMRDYLYARLSIKDPFDILYFTPAVTALVNLSDTSWSLSADFPYAGITNLQFRLKAVVLGGPSNSEYGEKLNDYRIAFRAGYYF